LLASTRSYIKEISEKFFTTHEVGPEANVTSYYFSPFSVVILGREGTKRGIEHKDIPVGMLSSLKWVSRALKQPQRVRSVRFRIQSGSPASCNPLNTKTRDSRRGPVLRASRWWQDLEHKNTPIGVWFCAQSGRQRYRSASNLLGRDFVLEKGRGGGKASNRKHTT